MPLVFPISYKLNMRFWKTLMSENFFIWINISAFSEQEVSVRYYLNHIVLTWWLKTILPLTLRAMCNCCASDCALAASVWISQGSSGPNAFWFPKCKEVATWGHVFCFVLFFVNGGGGKGEWKCLKPWAWNWYSFTSAYIPMAKASHVT